MHEFAARYANPNECFQNVEERNFISQLRYASNFNNYYA